MMKACWQSLPIELRISILGFAIADLSPPFVPLVSKEELIALNSFDNLPTNDVRDLRPKERLLELHIRLDTSPSQARTILTVAHVVSSWRIFVEYYATSFITRMNLLLDIVQNARIATRQELLNAAQSWVVEDANEIPLAPGKRLTSGCTLFLSSQLHAYYELLWDNLQLYGWSILEAALPAINGEWVALSRLVSLCDEYGRPHARSYIKNEPVFRDSLWQPSLEQAKWWDYSPITDVPFVERWRHAGVDDKRIRSIWFSAKQLEHAAVLHAQNRSVRLCDCQPPS